MGDFEYRSNDLRRGVSVCCPQCCDCIVVVVSLIAQWLDVVLWSRLKQLASDLYEISEFSITSHQAARLAT